MSGERFGLETQTVQISTGDPTSVNDEVAQNQLGTVILFKGLKYRYVKFDNGAAVASAANGVAHWKVLTPTTNPPIFTVTSDQTDALATIQSVAGIFGGVVTDLFHCFIQISGPTEATVATATTVGDAVIGGTTDLTFGLIAEATDVRGTLYGTALTTGTSGTATVLLQNLDW
jgi:hypothetical protein